MLTFSRRDAVMSVDINRLSHFFAKKHSYLTCLLLVYVAKYGLHASNQEGIYDAWVKNKPSRTTFVKLLKELEEIGVITRVRGRKKSSIRLEIDHDHLIYFVGLKPLEEFIPMNCWVFKTGTFSADAFQPHNDFQYFQKIDNWKAESILTSNEFVG